MEEKQKNGDAWGTAAALTEWGSDALLRGDAHAAHAAFTQCASLRRALGDRWGAAEADAGAAQALAAAGGDSGLADTMKQRAAREMDAMGDVQGIAASFLNLGYAASEQDDWEAALPLLRDAVSLFQTQNDHHAAALVLWLIAQAAVRQNELPLAISAAEEVLTETQADVWAVAVPQYPIQKMEPAGETVLTHSADGLGETRINLLAARLLTQIANRPQTEREPAAPPVPNYLR